MSEESRKQKVPNFISLKVNDELKELIGSASDSRNLPMNEFIVQVVAQFFKRPDLGWVPREKIGRKRLPLHANGNGHKKSGAK